MGTCKLFAPWRRPRKSCLEVPKGLRSSEVGISEASALARPAMLFGAALHLSLALVKTEARS